MTKKIHKVGDIWEVAGRFIHKAQTSTGRKYYEVGDAPADFEKYYGLPRFSCQAEAESHVKRRAREEKEEAKRLLRAEEAGAMLMQYPITPDR